MACGSCAARAAMSLTTRIANALAPKQPIVNQPSSTPDNAESFTVAGKPNAKQVVERQDITYKKW